MRNERKGTVITMVDLRAKPCHLTEEDISWMGSTITGMTNQMKRKDMPPLATNAGCCSSTIHM